MSFEELKNKYHYAVIGGKTYKIFKFKDVERAFKTSELKATRHTKKED